MKQALSLFFRENLAEWFRARGFVLVLIAALVPAGLTSAWVYTHQGDLAVTEIEWDPEGPVVGDVVNITTTVENAFPRDAPGFDVLVRVGFYQQVGEEVQWRSAFEETVEAAPLGAEEETTLQVQWSPGERDLGTHLIEVHVDPDEGLRETQRGNNFRFVQIQVHSPEEAADPTDDPDGPGTDGDGVNGGDGEPAGEGNQTFPGTDVHLALDHPPGIYVQEQVNLTVVAENRGPDNLENATLRIRVERERLSGSFVDGQITQVDRDWVQVRNESSPLDIPAGEEVEEDLSFTPNQVTRYRVTSWVEPEGVAQDPNASDFRLEQTFMVDRREVFEEPPEGMTAKVFYQSLVMGIVHLKILIPLIALFYAGGIISDERRKNTLPYLLTRPIPRWTLPMMRLVVSFIVAGVAVTIGVLAVAAILLGQPGSEPAFLYWPLGLTLGALFVYGAVFTLLGIVTERPYLWGMIYVIGFEGLIFVGRMVGLLQSWSEFLSIYHWFMQVFLAWNSNQIHLPWLSTTTSSAWLAGVGLLVIGVGAMIACGVLMQRKEFVT